MSVVLAFLAEAAVVPMLPPVMPRGQAIDVECDIMAPNSPSTRKLAITLLAEADSTAPESNDRSRVARIRSGFPEIIGEHRYGWNAFPGSLHEIQVNHWDIKETFQISLRIPNSYPHYRADKGGIIIYKSTAKSNGVVATGFCRTISGGN